MKQEHRGREAQESPGFSRGEEVNSRPTLQLHLVYLNDAAAESCDESRPSTINTGARLRISIDTFDDGRRKVVGTFSQRKHGVRASGKKYHYWKTEKAVSITRSKTDLVLLKTFDSERTVSYQNYTQHLFTSHGRQADVTASFHPVQASMHSSLRNLMYSAENPRPTLRHSFSENLEDSPLKEISAEQLRETLSAELTAIEPALNKAVGELPDRSQRFPLIRSEIMPGRITSSGAIHFLDAQNYRQVAENAFGITRYRKPLAKEIQRRTEQSQLTSLNYYRLFRGLVPIDWIIEAMRRETTLHRISLTTRELRVLRSLLRRVPAEILRRILAEPIVPTSRILNDTTIGIGTKGITMRDLDLINQVIAVRGQKSVRSAQDLETLVRALPQVQIMDTSTKRAAATVNTLMQEAEEKRMLEVYNESVAAADPEQHPDLVRLDWQQWKDPGVREHAEQIIAEHRRARMDARQREREQQQEQRRQQRLAEEAERAAWAAETTEKINGLHVENMTIVVAENAQTLDYWGSVVDNCISGYSGQIGLDVFAAVIDEQSVPRMNLQISQEHGLSQMLGYKNRDAAHILPDHAQSILDALSAAGICASPHALGLQGLTYSS